MIIPTPVLGWLVLLTVALSGVGLAAAGTAPRAKAVRTSKHAGNGITCAQCHGQSGKKAVVPMEKCLSCHGDTKELAAKTAKVKPLNPHESRHYGTDADCNLCHHEHMKSENLCLPCHKFNFQVP
jgi:RecJ-like exonuclease